MTVLSIFILYSVFSLYQSPALQPLKLGIRRPGYNKGRTSRLSTSLGNLAIAPLSSRQRCSAWPGCRPMKPLFWK
ncbi:unnamed protein product [Protopolystoma xenopodis]|uniref:Uncharacterized protein n=1 Tax=Protopolystoma xenopodis TaxID=117903 RepID=A0A3S5CRT9_9PLAT|nr:unnamed protein product [Protopolystoma xenopodis]